jgi:hypothetical protein
MRMGPSPTPCNWGQVPGQAYAASVAGVSAAFTSNYAFGFKNTILTGHLNGEQLIADVYNVFEDGSGLSTARGIDEAGSRAKALAEVLPWVPEEEQPRVLSEALSAAGALMIRRTAH